MRVYAGIALRLTAEKGRDQIVALLLEKCPDIKTKDAIQALKNASERENAQIVALIKLVRPDVTPFEPGRACDFYDCALVKSRVPPHLKIQRHIFVLKCGKVPYLSPSFQNVNFTPLYKAPKDQPPVSNLASVHPPVSSLVIMPICTFS